MERKKSRQKARVSSFFTRQWRDGLSSTINVLYWSASMKKRFLQQENGGGVKETFSSLKDHQYYSTQVKMNIRIPQHRWASKSKEMAYFMLSMWLGHFLISMEVTVTGVKQYCVSWLEMWKCFDELSLICPCGDCGGCQSNLSWWLSPCLTDPDARLCPRVSYSY